MQRQNGGDNPFPAVLAAARTGEAWALARIYTSLGPAVAGLLRLQDASEPEDLTSEVFVGVLRRIEGFAGDEAAFRSWVFTIAYRRLADERRRRARRPPTVPLDDLPEMPATDDVAAEVERSLATQRVRALCDRLGPGRARRAPAPPRRAADRERGGRADRPVTQRGEGTPAAGARHHRAAARTRGRDPVTGPDDRSGGTDPGATLDAVVERCLQGQATGDAPASLVTFLDDVRVATGGPPPPPSAALEALLGGAEAPHEAPASRRGTLAAGAARPHGRLRHGPAAGPARRPRRARGVRLAQRLAAAGLAGKAVLALALGGTAAAGAGAAGVLPDPVDAVVRRVIELVTPFELPNEAFARLDGDDSARPPADGPGHVHPAGGDRPLSEPGTTADHAAGLADVTGESPSSDPVAGASAPVFDEAPVTVAAPSATQTGQPAPPTTTTTTTTDDPPQTQPPVTGEVTAGPDADGSGGGGAAGPVAGPPPNVHGQGPGSVGAAPDPRRPRHRARRRGPRGPDRARRRGPAVRTPARRRVRSLRLGVPR